MDYREAAKELLAKKIELKNAYVSLGDEITMLENEKFAIRKCVGDTAVAAGGGSKYEEYITSFPTTPRCAAASSGASLT